MPKFIVGHYYTFKKMPDGITSEISDSFTEHPIQECTYVDIHSSVDRLRLGFKYLNSPPSNEFWSFADEHHEALIDVTDEVIRKEARPNLPEYTFSDFEDVEW